MKILDLENWNRKEHYHFFSQYDEPFFGLVSEIDCTIAYQVAKKNNYSFF
ncbi:MAG: CatA-like O-acetyltransferase, partial [Cyclobacteriaceae bacterium]|nr:CatA-like O-acetyltransferase [Cyclobacteriaceae bacterium]